MRLTLLQKCQALLGAFKARDQIKHILAHNYYASKKTFPLNYAGLDIRFNTTDYYSTAWFYQQSQVENFIYEPAITKLLVERLKTCRCFADVGANVGYFTTIAAKVRPDIPVYSFELDGTLVPLIRENLRTNGATNAEVVNAAIGENDESSVSFTPHPYSFLGMISGISTDAFSVKHTTRSLCLDHYFQDKPIKPNFLKVDIDGAEMAMLRGAETLLAQDDLEMLLEVHTYLLPPQGSSTAEVLGFLLDRGFRCYRILDFRQAQGSQTKFEDVTERPEVLVSEGGDMLFVSRDRSPSVG